MAPTLPKGFYPAAFAQAPQPQLVVESGEVLKINDAFATLVERPAAALEGTPIDEVLTDGRGQPLALAPGERRALLVTTDGQQPVRLGVSQFTRAEREMTLVAVLPSGAEAPADTQRYERALEKERERTLAAARVGLQAVHLAAKLNRAPGLLDAVAGAGSVRELFVQAADHLASSEGLDFAGAAILLADGDQLLLQHSTFPQPGRVFDRSQDHRYARMARGDEAPVTEDGECMVPLRVGLEEIGYLVVRVGEEERARLESSAELREALLSLCQLLGAQLGLLCRALQQTDADDDAATPDGLTGLPRKPVFERTLGRELLRARRYERPLTIALVGLDLQPAARRGPGWQAQLEGRLAELARVLVDDFRAIDLISRYRQEMFGILLPETSLAQAKSKAESLRTLVERHFEATGDPATISIGLTARSWETTDWRQLLERAEQAQQEASQLGGNLVCFWGETIGRVPKRVATLLE